RADGRRARGFTQRARARLYKKGRRGVSRTIPVAVLGEHGEAVGTEPLACGPLVEGRQRNELAAHDLLELETERAVVHRPVRHPVHDGMRVLVAEREERLDLDRDAELLARLAPRPVVERLARGEHAADGDVP